MPSRTSSAMVGQDKLSSEEIVRADPRRVYELYDHWPSDVEDALKIQVDVPRKKYERVIYLAVGGSATAGDIISDWFLSSGGIEISVFRGNLPKVSLENALVIVCSTSGDTEETIQMARTLVVKHPDMVAISAGGRLKELAEKEGIVHVGIRLRRPRGTPCRTASSRPSRPSGARRCSTESSGSSARPSQISGGHRGRSGGRCPRRGTRRSRSPGLLPGASPASSRLR